MRQLSRTCVALSVAALPLLAPAALPQGGDRGAEAQEITGVGTFPFDNSEATTDGSAAPGCEAYGTGEIASDVWFRWTAPESATYFVDSCGQTDVDTRIAVYAEEAPAAPLDCADDTCGIQSRVSFTATAGASYLLRVGCYPGAPGGSGTFTINQGAGGDCDMPSTGPDVIVGDLNGLITWGAVGDIAAYSIGTTSCNVGDTPVDWISFTSFHPVIGQSIYKLEDGRLEQLGISWLKHGFTALQEDLCCTCTPSASNRLGVGCSDPYGAGLNGNQGMLGPRFEVNPATGEFPWPPTGIGTGGNVIRKRLQVVHSDLDPALHPTALYFGEGQYVTLDDATADNNDNNCSYRPISVNNFDMDLGAWQLSLTGMTERQMPAIQAWQDTIPTVRLENVQVPGDGLFILGSHATDNGDGTWRYEYAIFNMNSDRAGQRFNVPVPPGVSVTNIGFHDVAYHSGEPFDGTDWTSTMGSGSLSWRTQTYDNNPDANALRWGTLYNFWFDASAAPVDGDVALTLFKPGTPTVMVVGASVPDGDNLPMSYCQTSPNSVGSGALMAFTGSTSITANSFVLEATGGIPGGSGLFYYGGAQIQVPFGNGFRCVGAAGGGTHRLNPPVQADGSGFSSRAVDFTLPPAGSGSGAITAFSSWNFQLWYRDNAGGGDQFNLSDGLTVTFTP